MYTRACGAGSAGGCGTLAFTGLSALHYIVAAATLVMVGVVLLHLIPKREA